MKRFSLGFKVTLAVAVVAVGGVGAFMIHEALTLPVWRPNSASVRMLANVEYGRVGPTSLRLDVYQPRGWSLSSRPALLLIHGGGWVEGDKRSEQEIAEFLVPRGYVAFAINYRLAHEGHDCYPAQALDVRRAARWVRAHARDYGANPDRLGAVGWSAGGHLAALLGTTDQADPADPNSALSSRVDCVVDTAGPTDFTDEASPPLGSPAADLVGRFFGKPRDQIPDAYRDASPILHIDARSAPTLIAHGVADVIVPVDQSRRFDRALKAAGVEVKYLEYAGEGHGINQAANHQHWLDEIDAFLTKHLRR